jgi:hypothetical protein
MTQTKTYLVFLTLLLTSGGFGHAFGETYAVKFRVVDPAGQPIADADLATRWICDDTSFLFADKTSGPKPFSVKAATDTEGLAEVVFEDYSNHLLLGYSKDRKLAGFVIVERQDEGNTLEIKFSPTIEVSAQYKCSETDSVPTWTNMIVSIEEVRGYFFEFRSTDGKVQFPFPVGKWKCRIYGSNIKDVNKEFEAKPDEPFDFGTIDFEPTAMAKLIGKPAPEIQILDARGVPKDFQLADYKGKWVLIEFWGHW